MNTDKNGVRYFTCPVNGTAVHFPPTDPCSSVSIRG